MSLVIYFLPVRVNVDTLARFWNALRNYAGVVAANTVISLPPNVNWLSFPEAPTKLFVRKAYLDLVGILFGSTSMLRYCVLGTPGTGKTYFFYYLLLWCAQNKRNVVAALPSPLIYLVFEGASDHVEALTYPPVDLLMDRSTILLADSITPVPANGPIALTTSPRKEIFQSFIRRGAQFLYMPVWTLDELLLCRRLCEIQISDAELVSRFRLSVPFSIIWQLLFFRFGGCARYCLTSTIRMWNEEVKTCFKRPSCCPSICSSLSFQI